MSWRDVLSHLQKLPDEQLACPAFVAIKFECQERLVLEIWSLSKVDDELRDEIGSMNVDAGDPIAIAVQK